MNTKRRIGAAAMAVSAVLLLIWVAKPVGAQKNDAEPRAAASVLTVSVVQLAPETWPQTLQASGPLMAWEEMIISPETGGLRVAELLVEVGAQVQRGQVLARLADETLQAELRKQEAVVARARASLAQAASNASRARAVEGSGALSVQRVEEYRLNEATARASLAAEDAELERLQLRLAHARVIAPDDGLVIAKSGVVGDVVPAGAELYRLLRQGRVEWRPELDARQLSQVQPGQSARLTLPDGQHVEGTVRVIEPTVNAKTGRAAVYVQLPVGSPARAGSFASGEIRLAATPVLSLPQSAVVLRDGRSYVYVLGPGDVVHSRVVSTGRRHGDRVEVLSGLDRDARVVASGGAFLSEGARVTVAAAATPPTSHLRERSR